jgi:hypothetical protein
MNNYDDWAQLVAKNLEHEASFIAAIDKNELDDKAASDAFVRAVLDSFLPENYGIGSGRVIDAFGNSSEYLDIIIYNRDFPRLGMRGTHNTYLYESVLASFAIRAKFIRKTFFDSLNACASLSHLETKTDQAVLVKLAKKNGLKPGPNKTFVHDDPLRTGRFELIGRPPAFVFGFSGIKYSYRQLQENIELWIKNRQQAGTRTPMKALPAVIATQGCFAWRNAAPLALSNNEMLGIGNDDAPVRLIVLQMMYLLNRRLNVTSDGYGLKPSLNGYLSQFSAPKFELGVGDVADMINQNATDSGSPAARAARDTARFEPARDRAAIEEAAARATTASPADKPARPETPAPSQAPEPPVAARAPEAPVEAPVSNKPAPFEAAQPVAAKKPEKADKPADAAVFDKPSPFASAPIPPAEEPAKADKPADAVVFDKPSPFASAPIPPAEEPAKADKPADAAVFDKPSPFASAPIPPAAEPSPIEPPRSPVPSAPLGSAPIPGMQAAAKPMPVPESSPPGAPLGSAPIPAMDSPKPAAAKIIPPKPPVDIDLGFGGADSADKPEPEDEDFIQTVVIPPNAGVVNDEKSRNSTDAFIARVKEQLSASEAPSGNEKDFSSTIPQ